MSKTSLRSKTPLLGSYKAYHCYYELINHENSEKQQSHPQSGSYPARDRLKMHPMLVLLADVNKYIVQSRECTVFKKISKCTLSYSYNNSLYYRLRR